MEFLSRFTLSDCALTVQLTTTNCYLSLVLILFDFDNLGLLNNYIPTSQ